MQWNIKFAIFQEKNLSGGEWDELLFESAKSSLIFEMIESETSVGDVVSQSMTCLYLNMPRDYNRRMVQRILEVTIDDLKRVLPKYVEPLFVPEKSWTTVICHSSKAAEIGESFKK